MKRIFPVFNAVIAIASGVLVLFGYFINVNAQAASASAFDQLILTLGELRILLLRWSVLLAGVAVLIGVLNLFSVHLQKIRQQKPGAVYSLVLLVFFLITFMIVMVSNSVPGLADFQKILLDGIMVPVEISLLAVLAVTLLYSIVRMLRWRIDLKTIVFLATALLVLVIAGASPLVGNIPGVGEFVQGFLVAGGARGILIGVALGTLTTGLRILFGADRPYGDK